MIASKSLDETLIDVLHEQTTRNHLHWKETANEDSFIVLVPDGLVEVSQSEPDDVKVIVFDRFNQEITRIQPRAETPTRAKLMELWTTVRDRTLQSDSKLQAIIDQLRKQDSNGR